LHTGVRIVCLIALAAALPALAVSALGALFAAALLALYAIGGRQALGACVSGLWRLRWLMFAIAALYLWQSPGEPIWPQLPGLTDQGAVEAARRILILAVLLASVFILTRSTPAPDIASGIVWLCRPLRLLRFPTETLALRIALVFDAVRDARSHALRLRGQGGLISAAAEALAAAERGELAASDVGELPTAGVPRVGDFLILIIALLLLFAVHTGPWR
jgi:hypothetical protein